MKKVKTLLMAITGFFTVILASCSSSYEPKTIEATSEEFTSGELAKYVSIGSSNGELSFLKKDGAIETQYIRLKVKLEMQRDGFKNVDARDINFTKLLSVAVINLVDKDGVKIQDLTIKDEELLKLKKLLTGDKGDSKDIIFEGEFHNSEDAPKWFDKTTNFTPYLTGDIIVEINSNSNFISNLEDWDKLLDKYELLTTKIVGFEKRQSSGKNITFEEKNAFKYQDEDVVNLNQKFETSYNEMSRAQLSRYSEITKKYLEGMGVRYN